MPGPNREQEESTGGRQILRSALPGCLLALVCLLPFLNKAYTIDDPYFLTEARQALTTPLTPTAAQICWDNIGYKRPLRQIGPPAILAAYMLTPAMKFGADEWVAHLTILLTMLAAVVATVSLAYRCGTGTGGAMWAGLLYASCPSVLGMAGTVMPDIAVGALAVIGMERLLAWKADARLHQGLAAGIALGLAPMGRAHALFLLPIAALWLASDVGLPAWNGIRAIGWFRWFPIVLALACFGAVTILTSDPGHASSGALFVGGPNAQQIFFSRIGTNLMSYGMAFLITAPLAIVWLLVSGKPGVPVLMAAVGAGLCVVLKYGIHWGMGPKYLLGLTGVIGVGWVVMWAWQSRQSHVLWLALWLLIPLPLLIFQHLPAKYTVPCAPAAAILLVLRLESENADVRRMMLPAAVCLGALVGIGILHADSTFAGMARNVMADLAPQIRAGRSVWYSGQWALTWYGEQSGAACLTSTTPLPSSGDLVVAGEVEGGVYFVQKLGLKRRLVRTIRDTGFGVRTMNGEDHICFFSNGFGYLPVGLSGEPVNTYYVWQVE
jgi:hypothetical protein